MVTVINNWSWRKKGDNDWQKCHHDASTTEIFPDLFDAGLIPEPFNGANEKLVQWVGETDWEYAADFLYNDSASSFAYLFFEGLDTFATVSLNGEELFKSENMFHEHRIDVRDKLKIGMNKIEILFESALRVGKSIEKVHGENLVFNGESSRAYVRKAQYHYGWDWGPVLLTCGPYRPIQVETFDAKITEAYVHADVNENLDAEIDIQFNAITAKTVTADVRLEDPHGKVVYAKEIQVSENKGDVANSVKFFLKKPELWYPINHGLQKFYTLQISLSNESSRFTKRVGLRRVELIQHELDDQKGTSFFFKVNNVPIFAAGSNWIPGHSFLTRFGPHDYKTWINLLPKGNQNMLRVWGGGVYEDESLYTACDEAGIMVWQDLAFACAQYPYYEEFSSNVKKEIEDQLKRLRNHCSIVCFAGNNEDYMVAEMTKLGYDSTDHSGNYQNTTFPARQFYEVEFPKIVEQLIPGAIYWPGSPWGGENTFDATVGDIHQWQVWHGKQEKYQEWARLAGRFISEFGMLGFPNLKTLKSVVDDAQLFPQSEMIDFHTKADGYERRLATYVMENFRIDVLNIQSWIYVTQLMQAECLTYAYRHFRRNWKGPHKEYTGGALVWQLNDCWPCVSWSLCDFYRTPKLSYYSIKRENATVGLGMCRNRHKKKGEFDQKVSWLQQYTDKLDVWGVNMKLSSAEYHYDLRIFNIKTGKLVSEQQLKATLQPNRVTELIDGITIENDEAVSARLFDSSGKIVHRTSDWPQPLKYVSVPDRGVRIKVENGFVVVSADRPTKGIELQYDGPKSLVFQDNGFDVFPGDEHKIEVNHLSSSDLLTFRFYGSDFTDI